MANVNTLKRRKYKDMKKISQVNGTVAGKAAHCMAL